VVGRRWPIVGLALRLRLNPPSALVVGLGGIVLVAAALLVGYEFGRMTPSQTAPHFDSVSLTAHCAQLSEGGTAYFRDCQADGVFRNTGGAGSAPVTLNGYTANGSGSCVAAIPRTQAGDVVEVTCSLKSDAANGLFRGVPSVTATVGPSGL
jgi:hypothetical protein